MSPRRIGLVAASLVALAPALAGTLRAAAGGVAIGSASASASQLATHHAATAAGVQRRPIRLTWQPPPLVNPIRLTITSAHDLQLDRTRDYILELPRHRSLVAGYGCIHIEGGHNIVLIGGACYAPRRLDPTEGTGRVFYIEGNTGTVHIEGLYAYGPGLTEGIDVFNSPNTVLQVENCRFQTIHNWGQRTIHSDLIQADSLAALRVDRFTGFSQVQGVFRDGASPAPAGADLRHVNITGVRGGTEGRLLWNGSGPLGPYALELSDVWILPFRGDSLGTSVWPGVDQSWRLAPRLRSDASLEWPFAARISGVVHSGRPPGGDFVPAGVAGLAYVSPGYSTVLRRG
jgi:hypothetical protein